MVYLYSTKRQSFFRTVFVTLSIILSTVLFFSFYKPPTLINKKELIGKHWVGNLTDSINYSFEAKSKYNSKFYQWGSGYSEGLEFINDGSVYRYHNILCSTESNPQELPAAKWKLYNDTLSIYTEYLTEQFKITLISKKQMKLRILNTIIKH